MHSDVLDHNTMSMISGTVAQLAHHNLWSHRHGNTESIRLTAKVYAYDSVSCVIANWFKFDYIVCCITKLEVSQDVGHF